MFDGNFRKPFDATVAPVASVLTKTNLGPNAFTAVGIGLAGITALLLARGSFFLAFVGLVVTGFADAIDGAVAKATDSVSIAGAYFDSVADRVSDALLFFGLSWFYASSDTPTLALLPFALYIAAALVSYQRAKAESLGFDAKGGLMERAERFIVLGFGLVFSGILLWVLWLMLALTIVTALMRFRKVWLQAT